MCQIYTTEILEVEVLHSDLHLVPWCARMCYEVRQAELIPNRNPTDYPKSLATHPAKYGHIPLLLSYLSLLSYN